MELELLGGSGEERFSKLNLGSRDVCLSKSPRTRWEIDSQDGLSFFDHWKEKVREG